MRESLSPAPLGNGSGGELGLCRSMDSTLLITTHRNIRECLAKPSKVGLPICISRIPLFGSKS
jgi:hypothetical protein